ncbi:MAG: hypothetical protein GY940_11820, partial [bacterium]|nr:hypothetical protein [bacterium]
MILTILLITGLFFHGGLYSEEIDYSKQRELMVQEQIFQRGITNKPILDAFRKVKRHLFVVPEMRDKAYGSYSLSIGEDQIVSNPYIVAIMTYVVVGQKYDKKVLDIGTGSGYLAAILAEQVKSVYTIEYIAALAAQAKKRLDGMGYK